MIMHSPLRQPNSFRLLQTGDGKPTEYGQKANLSCVFTCVTKILQHCNKCDGKFSDFRFFWLVSQLWLRFSDFRMHRPSKITIIIGCRRGMSLYVEWKTSGVCSTTPSLSQSPPIVSLSTENINFCVETKIVWSEFLLHLTDDVHVHVNRPHLAKLNGLFSNCVTTCTCTRTNPSV